MPKTSDSSDAQLEMSDLVGAAASAPRSAVPDPPEVAPSTPAAIPVNPSLADDTPPAPTPGQAVNPAAGPPVFRNPLAAGYSTQMADFGAAVGTTAPAAAPTDKLIKLNLAPHFDTFSAHGLADEKTAPTTLLAKISQELHFDKFFSDRNLRYAGVGLLSFAIFLFVFNFQTLSTQIGFWLNPPKPQAPIASILPVAGETAVGSAQAEAAPAGDVIAIPKLNLSGIPIVFEPTLDENAIQKSLQKGIVHYAGTGLPGEHNNMVVVGHSSNDWWEPGSYKFVFALLDKLVVGDQIQVNYQQKKYVYQVTGSKIVEPTEISVLQPTSEPQLTVITCTPPGTSWKRLVVVAKQIQPLPNAPKAAQAAATPKADTTKAADAALPGNAPSFLDQVKKWLGLAS